jgi:ribonuclease D
MEIITTTEQLAGFCAANATAEFVTVDTEFMRERTYWPKLCLVQVGGIDGAVAIDPLAKSIDLSPLFDLLANPKIMKVFHAARQDVEIFYNLTGRVPQPMFDTQVAAMVCGFGDAASYETLADKLANAKIDKSSRFTDWSNRPLTEKQITYALGDVTHLRIVYTRLKAQLEKSERAHWVSEEMAILTNPDTYKVNPQEIWRRFKFRADKGKTRALLRELCAWRENEAQRLDVPRGRIIRDEALAEIANNSPSSAHELARVRGLSTGFAESRQGKDILAAVARVEAMALDQFPVGERRRLMPPGLGPVVDLLKILLRQTCEEEGVAPKLIANVDDLEDIAANDDANVSALKGWRREVFGETALALKRGDIALCIEGKKIVRIKVNGKMAS